MSAVGCARRQGVVPAPAVRGSVRAVGVVRHRWHRFQLEVRSGAVDHFRGDVAAVLFGQLAVGEKTISTPRHATEQKRKEEEKPKRTKMKKKYELCVVVHDDGHAVHVESVRLRHHALAEPVRDVVRTQQTRDHDRQLRRDEGEHDDVPPLQNRLLEPDVRAFASWQDAAGVTRLTACSLDESVEVPAALQLILDPQTAVDAQRLRPLRVDLSFQVEGAFLVGDVSRRDEEGEADPEEERVPSEETAVVEEDARPANEGSDDTEGGGEGGDDEFGAVTDADDVGVGPDVEPDEEGGDEAGEGVCGELRTASRTGV